MYSDKIADNIQTEILENISDSYDKTEGSFIYDVTKATAIKQANIYSEMDNIVDKLDIENLGNEELEQFIYQRTGIERNQATNAIGQLTVNGNGTIYVGDLFETDSGVQFQATEEKSIVDTGTISIECLESGIIGNVPTNQITKIPVTLEGIINCNNDSATYDGFEAETDEALLERYYERIQTPSTSGNKAHYKNWAKEVDGVGDAKVFPLWNGDNTVKVVIIDADKQPASTELVTEVQDYIDPDVTGEGEGKAPIGAYGTISSAIALNINISISITEDMAYTIEQIQTNIENNIINYLKEIAFKQDYVSYAKVGSIILDTDGVLDYTNLTINSNTLNVTIADEEVAILGGVTIV